MSGGSSVVEDNVTKSNLVSNNGVPVGARTVLDGQAVRTSAVCSDYDAPRRIRELAASGDQTVMCPAGFIAVGGEGQCEGVNGKLVRTRPVAVSGEPRGWRATCSTGAVRVGVNCVEKGRARDWDGCQVVEKMLSGHGSTAVCQRATLAIASGARCGSGGNIIQTYVETTLSSAGASCTEPNTRALAICCPGVTQIP